MDWPHTGVRTYAFVKATIFIRGASADRTKLEAAKEIGPGYSLYIASLNIRESGRHISVSAAVAAWNEEVRDIPVHWEEGN